MPGTHASESEEALFAEIEAALSGSAAGRAFLADHARRSRVADTAMLLAAVASLEARVTQGSGGPDIARLRGELAEMADIVRVVREGAAEPAPDPMAAIREAAEQIQDTAWTLRERGFESSLCDTLDRLTTDISQACADREMALRGSERIGATLAVLQTRIAALDRVAAGRAAHAAQPLDEPAAILSDGDLDFVAAPGDDPEDGSADPLVSAAVLGAELERFEALGTRERLLLFT